MKLKKKYVLQAVIQKKKYYQNNEVPGVHNQRKVAKSLFSSQKLIEKILIDILFTILILKEGLI